MSLDLHEAGGAFLPLNPIVPILIAKTAAQGVMLPGGVSFAPVETSRHEPGTRVGNAVVWTGSATDTDFMLEPVPLGAEASWQLRSQRSRESNSLVFRLQPG